jgi:hypothetical protein
MINPQPHRREFLDHLVSAHRVRFGQRSFDHVTYEVNSITNTRVVMATFEVDPRRRGVMQLTGTVREAHASQSGMPSTSEMTGDPDSLTDTFTKPDKIILALFSTFE